MQIICNLAVQNIYPGTPKGQSNFQVLLSSQVKFQQTQVHLGWSHISSWVKCKNPNQLVLHFENDAFLQQFDRIHIFFYWSCFNNFPGLIKFQFFNKHKKSKKTAACSFLFLCHYGEFCFTFMLKSALKWIIY